MAIKNNLMTNEKIFFEIVIHNYEIIAIRIALKVQLQSVSK